MNQWQLIVLGLMVVEISLVVLFNKTDAWYHAGWWWTKTAQLSIPILLIGGFLLLVLKKKGNK